MGLRVLYHRIMSNYYVYRLGDAMDALEEMEAVRNARQHAIRAIELSDKTLLGMIENSRLVVYG